MSNCLEVLANYASKLNAANLPNTAKGIAGDRPHPLFWSQTNCSGIQWPDINLEPIAGTPYPNQAQDPVVGNVAFGSMYIPAGWSVTLTTANPVKTVTYPTPNDNSNLPILISNMQTAFTSGTPIYNNISFATIFTPIIPGTTTPYLINDWKFQMCMNQISTVVGAQHLVSWNGGSQECDDFMTSFCTPVSQLSCVPGTTQIAPLDDPYTACVCLVEQNCLKETFNQPTEPNANFAAIVPVTCFGKSCSSQGYRWGYMNQQRCTVTLCQQIISIIGHDIVVKGGSTLFCGNSEIPLVTVTPTITPIPVPAAMSLPDWAWILIGVVLFVLAIAVPLAIIVFRQAANRRRKESIENLTP